MRFERLSIEDGLSQSVVNCILQDATGFLWLGTQSGLNRYDGYGFTVYRHDDEDPASLAHDWILALLEDPSGDLWIGTEGGGLARWRRATDSVTAYRHDPGDPASLSGDFVVALAWDPSGALWVGTRDSGLNRFDPATETFQRFRHDPADPGSLASDKTFAVYVDGSGRLWVGTSAGLDLFGGAAHDPAREAFAHFRHDPEDPASLSDNRVRTIVEDHRGLLWAGTHRGLNRWRGRLPGRAGGGAAGVFERFLHDPADPSSLSHDWVRALHGDSDGRLWVGTDGGLNLWQEESGGFASYHPDPTDPESLGSDQIVSIYQDRSGVLWIAPVGDGVNRWNPGTWSFPLYASDDGAGASKTVFAVSLDPAGGLWTGTFGGGLERLDRTTGRRTRYVHDPADDSSLGDNRVTALLHDRRGTLWVGTVGGGLHRMAGERFERFRHDPSRPESLSADAVTALFEDRRGRLWVGTVGGGLDLLVDEGAGGEVSFAHFRHDPADPASLGNDRIFSLAEDREGYLWLATDGGGLNRLHPATGGFLRLRHDPRAAASLASDELQVVHVDAQGRLWVGTKGAGLDRLESFDRVTGRAVFRNYSQRDGLPDETIWGLRSDPAGDLWISTNNGLARLTPEIGKVTTYTTSHGLQSNEFNMGAHFASASGELFFGGVGGLNAFFADGIRSNTAVPPVVVTSFSKLNREVRLERPIFDVERIELGYRDYLVSFEIAALDFTAPEENRYRYQLEGLDADWVELGHRRRVTFTNLDDGRYTLRLAGSNNDGTWNREGKTLEIVVAPAPWETWWAYGLYALAAAAVVAGFVRRQQHRVELERAATRRQRQIARAERAQAEERRHLLEEREALIEELEAKNAELERFNYTVSHDLKSPLVTIKGFLGMLRKDAAAGDIDRLDHDVRRIDAAADRMRRLLDELLELSRLGLQSRPPEEVALTELAAEALEIVGGQAAGGEVDVTVAADLPMVFGDRVRLLQLYQNLLANAMKYMGKQRAPRIEVGVRSDGKPGGRVFFVRDNGMGIEARYHEKVFGLFERLDAADEGTGIGLALVKRIVEMHGGSVWVESDGAGRGSTFCFTLADSRRGDRRATRDAGGVVEAGDRFAWSSAAD